MSAPTDYANHSAASFTRKMNIDFYKKKLVNYNLAVQTFSSVIYTANDTAGFALFDCMTVLKKSPLYKREVKRLANEANRQYNLYQTCLRSNFVDSACEQLYLDFADNFQDSIKKHVELLRLVCLQVLTRLQVPEREVLSYITAAYSCFILAVDVFDSFFKAQEKTLGVNVCKEFASYRLTGCRENFRRIVEITMASGKDGGIEDTVCHDKDFQLACRCLEKQIVNNDALNASAAKAIQTNKKTVIKHLKK